MKTIATFSRLLFVAVIAMFASLPLAAQNIQAERYAPPFKSAQEAFTRISGGLKADAKPSDQALRQANSNRINRGTPRLGTEPAPLRSQQSRPDAPGEVPLLQQWTDASAFVDIDQEVHVSFTANLDWDGPIWSYSMLLTPGLDGVYDGTKSPDYFIPEIGDYGYVPANTMYEGRTFRNAATIKFTKSMPSGQYYLTTTIFDQQGNLIQQISSYIYYQVSSIYGRYVWYIDEAKAFTNKQGRRFIHLTGSFPMYSIMYAKVGTARGSDQTYSVFSTDGRNVLIPVDIFYTYASRDHAVNVSLWDPDFREVLNMANALVIKRTTNN